MMRLASPRCVLATAVVLSLFILFLRANLLPDPDGDTSKTFHRNSGATQHSLAASPGKTATASTAKIMHTDKRDEPLDEVHRTPPTTETSSSYSSSTVVPPLSSPGHCDPRGKAGDTRDNGNDVARAERIPDAEFEEFFRRRGSSATSSSSVFQSTIQRASEDKKSGLCYYRVTNFCVEGNSLVLYLPPSSSSASHDAFRLCCELRPKIQLRYRIAKPRGEAPYPVRDIPAHVTACWQYYGYHLFQCLASTWWVQRLHGFGDDVRLWFYNHAQSFPREVQNHFSHKMYMGSAASWEDKNPPTATRQKVLPSAYWKLWSQSTANPADVSELFKFPRGADDGAVSGECYASGIIGQPHHDMIPTAARRAHVQFLTRKFNIPPSPILKNGLPRVTLITRRSGKMQGSRAMTNFNDVKATLETFTPHVHVVDWAEHSVVQQIAIAQRTDILVSMHGAGNLWLAFLPQRSVLLEIWPEYPRRFVYTVMCRQYNIRYYELNHNMTLGTPTQFLHTSVTVSLPLLRWRMSQALEYIACARAG